MGGGAHIFILLLGEDVDASQVNLRNNRIDIQSMRSAFLKIFLGQCKKKIKTKGGVAVTVIRQERNGYVFWGHHLSVAVLASL